VIMALEDAKLVKLDIYALIVDFKRSSDHAPNKTRPNKIKLDLSAVEKKKRINYAGSENHSPH